MKIPAWLCYGILYIPVWIVCTGSLASIPLAVGVLVVLFTFPLSHRWLDIPRRVDAGRLFRRLARFWFFVVTVFIPDAVVSALEMTRRVIHPATPIRPGILAVHVGVTDAVTFLILANHVTLTPGQLIVDIDADRCIVYVHCVDAGRQEALRHEIAMHFEQGERMLS